MTKILVTNVTGPPGPPGDPGPPGEDGNDGIDGTPVALNSLTDVDTTGATDGNFLSQVDGVWVPVNAPEGGSGGSGGVAGTPVLVNLLRLIPFDVLTGIFPASFTDGNRDSGTWANAAGSNVIDLRESLYLDHINFLSFWSDARIVQALHIEGSNDNTTWTDIRPAANWQASTAGVAGLDVVVDAAYRYLRFSSNGTNLYGSTDYAWVEIGVFGSVILADNAGGEVGGSTALSDLTDVDLTTTPPNDQQALVFDLSSGQWVPGSVAAGGGSGEPLVVSKTTVNLLKVLSPVVITGTLFSALTDGNRTADSWSMIPGGVLTLDFGSEVSWGTINWVLYWGDTRTYNIRLEGSHDGTTWTDILPAQTFQPYTLGAAGRDIVVDALWRYLRFTGTGSANEWVEITAIGDIVTDVTGNAVANSLDDLFDVDMTGVVDGDFLQRVGGVWVPVSAPSGGSGGGGEPGSSPLTIVHSIAATTNAGSIGFTLPEIPQEGQCLLAIINVSSYGGARSLELDGWTKIITESNGTQLQVLKKVAGATGESLTYTFSGAGSERNAGVLIVASGGDITNWTSGLGVTATVDDAPEGSLAIAAWFSNDANNGASTYSAGWTEISEISSESWNGLSVVRRDALTGALEDGVSATISTTMPVKGSATILISPGPEGSGSPGAALSDLTDVDLTGATDGDFLQRVSGVWVPVDAPSGVSVEINAIRFLPVTVTGGSWSSQWVDGNTHYLSYADAGTGVQTRTIDFGTAIPISDFIWVLFWDGARTYHDVTVDVSNDGSTWTNVRTSGDFVATTTGLVISLNANWRYIRVSSNGSVSYPNNEWVEFIAKSHISLSL